MPPERCHINLADRTLEGRSQARVLYDAVAATPCCAMPSTCVPTVACHAIPDEHPGDDCYIRLTYCAQHAELFQVRAGHRGEGVTHRHLAIGSLTAFILRFKYLGKVENANKKLRLTSRETLINLVNLGNPSQIIEVSDDCAF